jgi:hypothetical protein
LIISQPQRARSQNGTHEKRHGERELDNDQEEFEELGRVARQADHEIDNDAGSSDTSSLCDARMTHPTMMVGMSLNGITSNIMRDSSHAWGE